MLVLEAAEQATAPARNLGRVQREALVLGEPQVDGGELGEPGRAAILPAAPPHTGETCGLVADADLAQLDPGLELPGQLADQVAEVHPLLGREVDRELLAVPLPLGVADLHREVVGAHPLDDLAADVLLGAAQLLVGGDLLAGGATQDRGAIAGRRLARGAAAAAGTAFLEGRFADRADPAEVLAAVGVHDHRVAHPQQVLVPRPVEQPLPVPLEPDLHGLRHQASVYAPIAPYFSARRRTSFSGRIFRSSPTCRSSASRTASPVAS